MRCLLFIFSAGIGVWCLNWKMITTLTEEKYQHQYPTFGPAGKWHFHGIHSAEITVMFHNVGVLDSLLGVKPALKRNTHHVLIPGTMMGSQTEDTDL